MNPTPFAKEQRRLGHGNEEACAWMFKTTLYRTTRSGALEAGPQTASMARPFATRAGRRRAVPRADRGWRQESLSTFPTLPKIYSPLILLAQGNVWDNLSRIFRDNGGLRLLLTWQGAAWYNVGTKLMEETCIRTRNAVRF